MTSQPRSATRSLGPVAAGAAALALLAGCTAPSSMPAPGDPAPTTPTSAAEGVQPAGDPVVVARGLTSPWSVLPLPDRPGEALISERDTAAIIHVAADGTTERIGVVPGVRHGGEGGLLGLALYDDPAGTRWLYAAHTAASDNRVVRMALDDALELGAPVAILTGLPAAGNHNGGRIAFGPDGMLYVTAGDAGDPARAQDPADLGGKLLRVTPTGDVPADNPFSGSPVYSLGHRNPQGLTWDGDGQLWAAEFGQNTWDELNRIEPGANYGWPVVEGRGGDERFVDPVHQWATSEASPSGLLWTQGTFFLAALRGARVWAIYPSASGVDAVSWFEGEYGRIRDVAPGPDGSLWFLTNNTDGRGSPGADDDRLLQVRLTPLVEG